MIESQVELLTSAQIAERVLNEIEQQAQPGEEAVAKPHSDKQIRDFLLAP